MSRSIRRAATLVLALGLTAQAVATVVSPSSQWDSPHGRDHPLAGTLWSARTGGTATETELTAALTAARVVLLGEVHDNPDHHRLQAWMIGKLAAASTGSRPAIVLEHIPIDRQPIIDEAQAAVGLDAASQTARLLDRLEWEKTGWPSRAMFQPVFEQVLSSGLPILAGDPERATVRNVARGLARALDGDTIERLQLNFPLDAPTQEALLEELEASHCGLMPSASLGNIAEAQRYRDAHLADRVLAAAGDRGSAVLLTGHGHVRTDRAVPWYLRRRAPALTIVSVALLEVEAGKDDPASYAPRDPAGRPVVDFVWLTPRAERPDPCVAMREMFRGKKK